MAFEVKEIIGEFSKGDEGIELNRQRTYIRLTALASDVVLDFGDQSGALMTDLKTTAIGQKVADYFQTLSAIARKGPTFQCDQLVDRVQVSSVSGANQFEASLNNKQVVIEVNAADGELVWEFEFEHTLNYQDVGSTFCYRVS